MSLALLGNAGWFMFLGLLGGLSYVIVNSKKWEDLITFDSGKRYMLGLISGFIYNILYSDYSFPNSIMAWVSGYMGTTFIMGLIDRFTESPKA